MPSSSTPRYRGFRIELPRPGADHPRSVHVRAVLHVGSTEWEADRKADPTMYRSDKRPAEIRATAAIFTRDRCCIPV